MDRVEYCLKFVGKPYIYGGKGPIGFDCSGLILEGLWAEGVLDPYQDLTAQGIYEMLKGRARPKYHDQGRGDLLFFGKSLKEITHVAMAINEYQVIEAGGGGRDTQTSEDAESRGAMVRVRNRWFHRSDILVTLALV